MIEIKDLEPGLLVWWSAARSSTRRWSFPAMVTLVAKTHFRVMGFNDFKVSDELRISYDLVDCREEMRPCSIDEVEDYLTKRRVELANEITVKETELSAVKNALYSFDEKGKKWRKKYTAKNKKR